MELIQAIALFGGIISYFLIRLLVESISDKIHELRYQRDLKSGKIKPYNGSVCSELSNNINTCTIKNSIPCKQK